MTDDPRFRLAAAVRSITESVVAAPIGDTDLTEAAVVAEKLARLLSERSGPGTRARPQPDLGGEPQQLFPTSPVIGSANPLAPPVSIWFADKELRGEVTFGRAYEGPPMCVQGGVIAEVFDEILGAANIASGNPGMTAMLTVRYRHPTPIETRLELVARCKGREGRKIHAWGAMYDGEKMTAEATGLFVEVRSDRMLGLMGRHEESVDS